MIKFLWYCFSILTIFFILISTSTSNNSGSSMNQSKILNFRSNQVFTQKLLAFHVSMFFILTILLLLINS
uniref:Preprotein-translocase subunit g n=1 Tax=Alsidium seaforthii TaxID=2007182 RepID=A0A1Z1MDD7_9FLOR|nr:preprotein-translocase subunit g [Bryothamnion seaforthii]ARW63963.1 preprotein-translocase subunit g [Bryothamnion seaforthii]